MRFLASQWKPCAFKDLSVEWKMLGTFSQHSWMEGGNPPAQCCGNLAIIVAKEEKKLLKSRWKLLILIQFLASVSGGDEQFKTTVQKNPMVTWWQPFIPSQLSQ